MHFATVLSVRPPWNTEMVARRASTFAFYLVLNVRQARTVKCGKGGWTRLKETFYHSFGHQTSTKWQEGYQMPAGCAQDGKKRYSRRPSIYRLFRRSSQNTMFEDSLRGISTRGFNMLWWQSKLGSFWWQCKVGSLGWQSLMIVLDDSLWW